MFRRRPSDDEIREELEAHVALRAEHDAIDTAAARPRLGKSSDHRQRLGWHGHRGIVPGSPEIVDSVLDI
jgi:hypothetical protein